MEDQKLKEIVIKIFLFILVIGAIAGVLFLATSQLKNLEFNTSSEPVAVSEPQPVQEVEKTEVVDEKVVIEKSTTYADNITDVFFLSETGDYAILLSLDPTLMIARLTNIDTNASVLYKDAIQTTISQAVSLDDSTLNKICLAASGKTEIDHYVRLSSENTRDLITFMQNEEKKNPTDLSFFQGEDLGTLFVDEFVDFANCKQLSFDSLSKFWSSLSAFSKTDISFNKLSEIILALKSYSVKRNWERLVFEPIVEVVAEEEPILVDIVPEVTEEIIEEPVSEEPIVEVLVEEPVIEEPVVETIVEEAIVEPVIEQPVVVDSTAPISFAFSQTSTIRAEDIQSSAKPESMNLEDATAQAVVAVTVQAEEKDPEPETMLPKGTIKKVKRAVKTWKSLRDYYEVTAGFGYSYGSDSKFTGWERELSARLEIGKKVTPRLSVFGSFRVLRNSDMNAKSIVKQYPKAYTLIPGIGFGLDFRYVGVRAEFNGYGIANEWKFNKIDYRMGASLIPYVSIPITQKIDINVVAPATISFKPNAYRISGALSIGVAYSEI